MHTIKTYIDQTGKLVIPTKVRKLLQLNKGDEVTLNYSETSHNEFTVSTFHSHLEKARDILNKYQELDLQAELTNLRNEDAKKS